MAIQWKRNSRYPSVTRPGVFPRIKELDTEGNDLLQDTWFELTGIDEGEMNKFKFALGSWVHISRRNRKIRILSPEAVNNVTYKYIQEPVAWMNYLDNIINMYFWDKPNHEVNIIYYMWRYISI